MSTPLYERIYHYVLEEIRAGRLISGARIPSENELAEQFHVSRITSKKALTILSEAGVITRIRGKGSFVSNIQEIGMENHIGINEHHIEPCSEGQASAALTGAKKSSGLVGLVIPRFSDSYGTKLVNAIEKEISRHGLHLILKVTLDHMEEEQMAIQSMVRFGIDGLIVFPVHGEHYNEHLLRLVLDGFPLVLVDRYLKGINACAVYSDNVLAVKMLTDHLLSLGHQNIVFASPPVENTSTIEERLQGFMQAFYSHGLRVPTEGIFTNVRSAMLQDSCPETLWRDQKEIIEFIKKNPQITAIVASELHVAELFAEGLNALGKRIPQDCSLVCFDAAHTSITPPRFTHIQQNQSEMGVRSVELLMKQMLREEVPSRTIVDFEFIDCGTTMKLAY